MTAPGYLRVLADAGTADLEDVGGKARGLGRLMSIGARVPDGFCVRSVALRDLLAVSETPDDLESLRTACAGAPVPPGLESQIAEALAALAPADGTEVWTMVRSSAALEDTRGASAPGVYTSVHAPARLPEVLAAIRVVWASALSENAAVYRRGIAGGPNGTDMAVIVQRYVAASIGGAIHTIDPASGDPTKLVVSWVDRHPRALLNGTEPGFSAVIEKSPVIAGENSWPAALTAVADEARRLERLFGEPLDIEFVVDEHDVPHLVQCRPIDYVPSWLRSTAPVQQAHEEETLHSPKIVAARFNHLAGGDLAGQLVIRPPVFEAIRQAGSVPAELRAELAGALAPLLARGAVALRPAYWSALNSADNLPQSGHLRTLEACLAHLCLLGTYITDHRLDDYSAEVAVLAGNWLETLASAVAAVDPGDQSVRVDAVPGYPEGLESLTYQTSTVDLDVAQVTARRMPAGGLAAMSPHGDTPTVALLANGEPALTDAECVRAAHLAHTLATRFGAPVRVELLVVEDAGRRGMMVWQVERFAVTPAVATFRISAGLSEGVARGIIVRVDSLDELAGIELVPGLLLLDMSAMRVRDRTMQALIAQHAAQLACPVVVRSSPLSHFSAILRYYGVTVFAVREIPPDVVSGIPVTVTRDD